LFSVKTHTAIGVGMKINLMIFCAVPKRCGINKWLVSVPGADVPYLDFR